MHGQIAKSVFGLSLSLGKYIAIASLMRVLPILIEYAWVYVANPLADLPFNPIRLSSGGNGSTLMSFIPEPDYAGQFDADVWARSVGPGGDATLSEASVMLTFKVSIILYKHV